MESNTARQSWLTKGWTTDEIKVSKYSNWVPTATLSATGQFANLHPPSFRIQIKDMRSIVVCDSKSTRGSNYCSFEIICWSLGNSNRFAKLVVRSGIRKGNLRGRRRHRLRQEEIDIRYICVRKREIGYITCKLQRYISPGALVPALALGSVQIWWAKRVHIIWDTYNTQRKVNDTNYYYNLTLDVGEAVGGGVGRGVKGGIGIGCQNKMFG